MHYSTSWVGQANNKKMEKYAGQLFQVAKDRNNDFITDMRNESNQSIVLPIANGVRPPMKMKIHATEISDLLSKHILVVYRCQRE